MKTMTVGIIGGTHGMGKWFARLLRRAGCTVYICGRKTRLSVDELAERCDVVVVSVPIAATGDVIRQVGPRLSKDKLLMDLTSLKEEPVKLMLAHTRANVIGCHPLFGPAMKDVSGQNVVMCPARGKRWIAWLRSVFRKNKLSVWEATPRQHDRMMAVVQALNHLNTLTLGMALAETNMTTSAMDKFSTPFFRMKMDIIRKVFTENPDMYLDIINGNPEKRKILAVYEKVFRKIRASIESGDRETARKYMAKAAKKIYERKN